MQYGVVRLKFKPLKQAPSSIQIARIVVAKSAVTKLTAMNAEIEN